MSDILARLADRALDAGGGLRPRIQARFEPETGGAAAFTGRARPAGPALEVIEAEGDPAVVRPPPAPPPTSPAAAGNSVDPPPMGAPARSGRVPSAPVRSEASQAGDTEHEDPQPVARPDRGRSPRHGSPGAADRVERPDATGATRVAARPERVARGTVAAPPAADRNGEPTPRIDRTAGAPADRPPAQRHDGPEPRSQPDDRETAAKGRDPTERPRAIAARLAGTAEVPGAPVPLPRAPGVRGMPQPSVPTPTRGERPVVHVSIGRIEVRAVTPPVQATPRRPAAPTAGPSLEAYLRARNGSTR